MLFPLAKRQKPPLEKLVPLALFLLGKVHLAELLGVIPVVQVLPELLAGEVKGVAVHHVIAVEVAVRQRDAVNLAAEEILYQKCRDGALPAGLVLL